MYTLDSIFDRLQIQNPQNTGVQTVPVVTTVDISTVNGFDIAAGVNVATSNSVVSSGSGLALLTVDGTIALYSIDLVTGAATKVGNFLNGTTPASGFAIHNDLGGIPAFALSGGQLLRFNTASPGTTTSVLITGVTAGELLVGIDFRPQTGQLFAFGVNASTDNGTLYLVDPQSGAATPVGTPGQIAFVDGAANLIDLPTANAYGMDFNPTVDRIRITTDTGLNFRINPNDGAPVDGDTGLAGVNPDGAISGLPDGSTGVSANAYTNSYAQSAGGVTTLYTLDSVSNSLFIQNPPNTGTQTAQVVIKLGGNTLDFTSVNGFDIPASVTASAANGTAAGFGFAGLTVGGVTSLYQINLVSGEATNLGAIGTGAQMVGLALADSPATPTIPSDFDGDGMSDIALQNGSSLALWLMNGTTIDAGSGNVAGVLGPGWVAVESGDFNGNGTQDLLLQNGQLLALWQMNGTQIDAGSGNIGTLEAGWVVAGTGDFNGDQNDDILLQNGQLLAVWQMDGTQIGAGSGNIGTLGAGWVVADTSDFNGDGFADVLLQNGQQLALWAMDGAGIGAGSGDIATLDAGWIVAGTGDFNGDQNDDILLQNGQLLAMWQMDGTQIGVGSGNIGTLGVGWAVADTGDYNGDGFADVLLQNGQQLAEWLLQGTQIQSDSGNIGGLLGPGWDLL